MPKRLLKVYTKELFIVFLRSDKENKYHANKKRLSRLLKCVNNGSAIVSGTISDGYIIPANKK